MSFRIFSEKMKPFVKLLAIIGIVSFASALLIPNAKAKPAQKIIRIEVSPGDSDLVGYMAFRYIRPIDDNYKGQGESGSSGSQPSSTANTQPFHDEVQKYNAVNWIFLYHFLLVR